MFQSIQDILEILWLHYKLYAQQTYKDLGCCGFITNCMHNRHTKIVDVVASLQTVCTTDIQRSWMLWLHYKLYARQTYKDLGCCGFITNCMHNRHTNILDVVASLQTVCTTDIQRSWMLWLHYKLYAQQRYKDLGCCGFITNCMHNRDTKILDVVASLQTVCTTDIQRSWMLWLHYKLYARQTYKDLGCCGFITNCMHNRHTNILDVVASLQTVCTTDIQRSWMLWLHYKLYAQQRYKDLGCCGFITNCMHNRDTKILDVVASLQTVCTTDIQRSWMLWLHYKLYAQQTYKDLGCCGFITNCMHDRHTKIVDVVASLQTVCTTDIQRSWMLWLHYKLYAQQRYKDLGCCGFITNCMHNRHTKILDVVASLQTVCTTDIQRSWMLWLHYKLYAQQTYKDLGCCGFITNCMHNRHTKILDVVASLQTVCTTDIQRSWMLWLHYKLYAQQRYKDLGCCGFITNCMHNRHTKILDVVASLQTVCTTDIQRSWMLWLHYKLYARQTYKDHGFCGFMTNCMHNRHTKILDVVASLQTVCTTDIQRSWMLWLHYKLYAQQTYKDLGCCGFITNCMHNRHTKILDVVASLQTVCTTDIQRSWILWLHDKLYAQQTYKDLGCCGFITNCMHNRHTKIVDVVASLQTVCTTDIQRSWMLWLHYKLYAQQTYKDLGCCGFITNCMHDRHTKIMDFVAS